METRCEPLSESFYVGGLRSDNETKRMRRAMPPPKCGVLGSINVSSQMISDAMNAIGTEAIQRSVVILPNVKDEPRRRLARLVRQHEA